jgi:hypothetical protein
MMNIYQNARRKRIIVSDSVQCALWLVYSNRFFMQLISLKANNICNYAKNQFVEHLFAVLFSTAYECVL